MPEQPLRVFVAMPGTEMGPNASYKKPAAVEVRKDPADWWRRFDLADALLFSGETAEARTAYDAAISLVPEHRRKDVLGTVLGPMRDLITVQILQGDLLAEVEHVIATMEDAIRDGSRAPA